MGGQEEIVSEFELDGVPMRSFYIVERGMNGDYHIIQSTGEPAIEMKMYISGGGLDRSFERMYSTLKFVD